MNIDKILNFFRKIGLLRSASGKWSGDATNRPASMSTDEIYNNNEASTKKVNPSKDKTFKSSLGLKILFNINIVLFIIVLISFIGNDTYNFWFLLNLIVWGYFFYLLIKALKIQGPNMKKLILGTVGLTLFSFLSFFSIPTTNHLNLDYQTKMDPLILVDLSLDLENNLLVEDVRMNETVGDILEIRMQTPENVSSEAVISAAAYIFSYLEPSIDPSLKTFRLILTVNNFDATVIECQRTNLKAWMSSEQTDEQFFASLKIQNLLK